MQVGNRCVVWWAGSWPQVLHLLLLVILSARDLAGRLPFLPRPTTWNSVLFSFVWKVNVGRVPVA